MTPSPYSLLLLLTLSPPPLQYILAQLASLQEDIAQFMENDHDTLSILIKLSQYYARQEVVLERTMLALAYLTAHPSLHVTFLQDQGIGLLVLMLTNYRDNPSLMKLVTVIVSNVAQSTECLESVIHERKGMIPVALVNVLSSTTDSALQSKILNTVAILYDNTDARPAIIEAHLPYQIMETLYKTAHHRRYLEQVCNLLGRMAVDKQVRKDLADKQGILILSKVMMEHTNEPRVTITIHPSSILKSYPI
eukprot:TRINITY_DN2017_c1_g1_i2.p1 TRINITY_DN2017_c1_g1~~TRINITY_DN2017_c1_g1_i2.p1  ORF type:complete len:250 (-),score=41.50 TRINITY_DN2017_c1_g1_i2:622-1371(-)